MRTAFECRLAEWGRKAVNGKTGKRYAIFSKNTCKKLVWPLLSVLIAVFSIWAVSSQMKQESLRSLLSELRTMSPVWLIAATVSMAGFIIWEAISLRLGGRALGIHISGRHSWEYAATDIYFSAITPSATGGQPASALFMMQDGIPGIPATAVLLMNLTMCSIATLATGIVCLLVGGQVFWQFGIISRILIGAGYVSQLLFALFMLLLLKKERLLYGICAGVVGLGAKLHLVRHKEEKLEHLAYKMEEYKNSVNMMAGKRGLLLQMFFCNVMQRVCQFAVTMFMFLAMRLQGAGALDIWALQGFVTIGSGFVPVPGGMGIADYLMLDGFGAFLSTDLSARLELLSRSMAFYLCILVCGGALILRFCIRKMKHSR